MKILISASTLRELEKLYDSMRVEYSLEEENIFKIKDHKVELIVTGVGNISTTHTLTRYILMNKPEWIFHLGIAGSYTKEYSPGDLVEVKTEIQPEMGSENTTGKVSSLFNLELSDPNKFPFKKGMLLNPRAGQWNLPQVAGATFELCTGTDSSAIKRSAHEVDIETQENAAVFYTCLLEGVPFSSFRAISNYVGKRNKKEWEMKKSLQQLGETMLQILDEL